jgi:hypothetical protein
MSLNFGGELFKQSAQYDDNGNLYTSLNDDLIRIAVFGGDIDEGSVFEAFDGSLTTYIGCVSDLGAGGVGSKYITITLDRVYKNMVCTLYYSAHSNGGDAGVRVTLQGSEDNSTWSDLSSTLEDTSAAPTEVFGSYSGLVTAKYLRLKINKYFYNSAVNVCGGRIYEISLFRRTS